MRLLLQVGPFKVDLSLGLDAKCRRPHDDDDVIELDRRRI